MPRVLITGANGQLGSELRKFEKRNRKLSFIFTDLDELDITQKNQVNKYFSDKRPDYLVNCAAYTAVDRAESEQNQALLLNSTALQVLADACKVYKTKLIHISTDFVFDGSRNTPYNESDVTNPVSIYGKSKLSGENQVRSILADYVIIRTSWLYAERGHNFVKTILKNGQEKGRLKVVYDQVGCPTYAGDLADAVIRIIEGRCKNMGVFHFSNEGAISWYDFAQAIIEIAGIKAKIEAVPSREFKTIAVRPNYSVLDKSKIKSQYGIQIKYWRDSLMECISRIDLNKL